MWNSDCPSFLVCLDSFSVIWVILVSGRRQILPSLQQTYLLLLVRVDHAYDLGRRDEPTHSPKPMRKRPVARGAIGFSMVPTYARLNLPRSVFLKRLSLPFGFSSRRMAEYKVAAGVLPPGLVQ